MSTEEKELMTQFRNSMRLLSSGVTVVTHWVDGRPWGLTVSACNSLSMDPPLMLVCLANHSVSTTAILEQGSYGVNIMGESQSNIAKLSSAAGKSKFIDEVCVDSPKTPRVEGALAYVHCKVEDSIVMGDHTIFIGKVDDVHVEEAPEKPLIYFDREFHHISSSI